MFVTLLSFGAFGFMILALIMGWVVSPGQAAKRVAAPEHPPFWNEAMEEVNRIDPLAPCPEFVEVPDGHYTRKVTVPPEKIDAAVRSWDSSDPIGYFTVDGDYEPCRIPKYRTELRWPDEAACSCG